MALLAAALLLLPTVAAAAAVDAPLAFFTLAPASTSTGRPVTADATAAKPSAGADAIAEHAWRWSEAEDYAPGNVTEEHAYAQAGVFVVGLRVTDSAGRVGFANQSVLVTGASPSAYFTFDRQAARDGGIEVVVNATFSEPSRGASRVVLREWDWGEAGGPGFAAGNVTETHFYATPGSYAIRLRVTDDQNRSAITVSKVDVRSTFLTRMGEVWKERAFFLKGAQLTVELAVIATLLGFALALVLALMRISRLVVLRWPAAIYVEFIRGTPLLVQILIVWLVFPFFGLKLPIFWAGALALIINTTAYQAEAIRAGIQGIPTGQMEAAASLGMSHLQAMRFVILPQAFRLTLPALGNEFIILLKDTSLVSVIGVVELTQVGRIISARTFLVLEVWLGVALVYFVMTYALSTGLRRLEKRLAIPGLGLGGAA